MQLRVLSFPTSTDGANSEAAPQNLWMEGLVLPNVSRSSIVIDHLDKTEKEGRESRGTKMKRFVMLSFFV